MLLEVTLSPSIFPNAPIDTDMVCAMDDDTRALDGGDNDGEGFITPYDSISKDDTVHIWEEPETST